MKPDYIDFAISEEEKQELAANRNAAAAANKQAEELRNQLHQRKEQAATRELVQSERWVTPAAAQAAAKLLGPQIKLVDDKLTVNDTDGHPIIGAHGPMTPTELLKRFRAENPNFVRQATASTTRESGVSDERLKTLFGAESVGKEAQKLATANLAEYRRLRTIAKERGIL